MEWRERVFQNFKLYAVTDLCDISAESVLRKAEDAFRGGVDIVQLRSKQLTDFRFLQIGQKIKKMAGRFRKLFFVNDRLDLAIALKADGIHLGQTDLPLPAARKLIRQAGVRMKIGKSTCDIRQAREAVRDGADYIGVGPVYATPTKPGRKPAGLDYVRRVARCIRIPWVAIGGIDLENIDNVIAAGAGRIAVVRAIFEAKDAEFAARELKKRLER
ncbi:MAG: Thiamine-phosphate synthase [Candidatus Omnitrophica bacterium ADurb.Bin277]|nr:MAG: Thiamine-phosphate synthase [Candidatus Omnitrophica bacterium ADurb.Bin277]